MKHKFWSSILLANLLLLSPSGICASESEKRKLATVEELIDKSVVENSMFKQLLPDDPWDAADWRKEQYDRIPMKCTPDEPGDLEARRALSLSAHEKFAEAIGEWTKAIDTFDANHPRIYTKSLDPSWVLNRASLFAKVNLFDEAIADVNRAIFLSSAHNQEYFKAVLLLIQLGQFKRAEEVTETFNHAYHGFRPYFTYLHALAQEKQSKSSLASESYKAAALDFAADGAALPAQTCMDKYNYLAHINNKNRKPTKVADLKPPNSNYQNILRLLKALTTRTDVFEKEIITSLIGADSLIENRTGYRVKPSKGHFKEINSLRIDKVDNDGKKMVLDLVPIECSINRSALKDSLRNKIDIELPYNNETGISEAFKVPAGTVVIYSYKGGFKSIFKMELYSKSAKFPENPVVIKEVARNPVAERAASRYGLTQWLKRNPRYAKTVIDEWIIDEPKNPAPYSHQAEIFFLKKDVDAALISIDKAIELAEADKNIKWQTKNQFSKRKAAFLVEKKRYKEADEILKEALTENLTGDDYFLRAQVLAGLDRKAEALSDLAEASKLFYNNGNIYKKLQIDTMRDTLEKPGINDVTEDETKKTQKLLETIKLEHDKRIAEKKRANEELISRSAYSVLISQTPAPFHLRQEISCILSLAETAESQRQLSWARKFVDTAIILYQHSQPDDNYDSYTRVLVNRLHVFKGYDYERRILKVARLSELFCGNKKLQQDRDDIFIRENNGDIGIALLEKLIDIRKEFASKTGLSTESLTHRLPSSYKGKGSYQTIAEYSDANLSFSEEVQNPELNNLYLKSFMSIQKGKKIQEAIRNKDFDISEELIRDFETEINKTEDTSAFNGTIIYGCYLSSADAFIYQNNFELAEKYLRKAIGTTSDTYITDVEALIGCIASLRSEYQKTGQFDKLNSLLFYASEQITKLKLKDRKFVLELRMSLAETLINKTGKSKQAEAIFDEVKDELSKNRIIGLYLPDVELRQLIAAKYPAIQKINLFNGVIVYNENHEGSRGGGIADGREFDINGPSSIVVNGCGNGRLLIRLDGQTLAEKGKLQLQNKNLPRAEEILVSALRANPEPDTFALIADCWFKQKKYQGAFEAASLALELDCKNNLAAKIKRASKSKVEY